MYLFSACIVANDERIHQFVNVQVVQAESSISETSLCCDSVAYLRNTVAAEARALDAPEVTEAAFS